MLTVVTGCEEVFSPGARALWNSIQRNVPPGEIDFHCLAFGNKEFIDSLPMPVIANPEYPEGLNFPKGGRWAADVWDAYPLGQNPSEYAMPAMYSRILIPELFANRDRVLWVDCDCIVVDSLAELETFDFEGHVMASTDITPDANGNFLSLQQQYGGHANNLGHGAPGTGTMLFNVPAWREKKITQRCFELMNSAEHGEWLSVVQSCIILAVAGDFAVYGWEYMRDVKKSDPPPGTKITHFPVVLPWDSRDLSLKPQNIRDNVKKHWEPYR